MSYATVEIQCEKCGYRWWRPHNSHEGCPACPPTVAADPEIDPRNHPVVMAYAAAYHAGINGEPLSACPYAGCEPSWKEGYERGRWYLDHLRRNDDKLIRKLQDEILSVTESHGQRE